MNKFLPVLMLGAMLSIFACEKKEERILPKVGPADELDVTAQSRLEREAFVNQAQNEIDELGFKLAGIRKKALESTGKTKEKLDQQVLALEQEQQKVEEKLAALRAEIGEKWKELKADITVSVEQFKQSVQHAIE